MRTLLKILGVAAVAFGVVFAWHIGTTMTPLDKYNQIQGCALRARLALEDRDAESAYPPSRSAGEWLRGSSVTWRQAQWCR